MVANSYADTLKGTQSSCVSVNSTLLGYSIEEITKVGNANLGLGCGNPLSFANLKGGENVVDLGSGAGIDCFLASQHVGSSGEIIGVDMTPDMIFQARKNAADNGYQNVFFRLGEIEHLPVGDNQIDVVISNCVINLSPDKNQVIKDMYRILKPGGRVAICDVVARDQMQLPDKLKTEKALAC
jgi:ubiquinone/menaquinone biosynthesis C-methylase UbiE